MCSICGGTVCAGTGGCQAAKIVMQNPQPVMQASITYAQASYSWVQSMFAAFFSLFQDLGRNSKNLVGSIFVKK